MSKRKRSPTSLPLTDRNYFEIPTSLLHSSTPSRSLAKQINSTANSDRESQGSNIVSHARSFSLPSLHDQQPSPTVPSNKKSSPTLKFIPQKQSFSATQPWPQPQPKSPPSGPIDPYALYRRQQDIARTAGPRQSPSSPPLHPPTSSSSATLSQSGIVAPKNNEGVARPGETLSLTRHADQIAALISKKRAENEANRNRQKWAKAQAEHLAKANTNPQPSVVGISSGSGPVNHSRSLSNGSVGTPTKRVSIAKENATRSVEAPSSVPPSVGTVVGNKNRNYQHNRDDSSIFSTQMQSSSHFGFGRSSSFEHSQTTPHLVNNDAPNQLPSPAMSILSPPDTQRPVSSSSAPKLRPGAKRLSGGDSIPIPPLFSDQPKSKPVNTQGQMAMQPTMSRSQSQPTFTTTGMTNSQIMTQRNPQIQNSYQTQPPQTQQHFTNSNVLNQAYYNKLDPEMWSTSSNESMPMPTAITSSYPQQMTLLSSSSTPNFYAAVSNSPNYYTGLPTSTPNYGNYNGRGRMNQTFQNADPNPFDVSKQ